MERRNVLDRAHRGDIVGALGRVRTEDARPLGLRRLWAFLVIAGPGIVVMVANNDAGSIAIFAQAGQDYGLRWVWLPAAMIGILFVIQEMAARLGAVTGSGHARLIFERFGPGWGWFALGDLLVLNVLTIVTEFVGLQFGLAYFGVDRYVSVAGGVAALLAVNLLGDFRHWERAALVLVGFSVAMAPLLLLVAHRHSTAAVSRGPSLLGTGGRTGIIFALALVGTTVAPWQLFFQQSNVVDKRITSRWLHYERMDTLVGSAVFGLAGVLLIWSLTVASAGTPAFGHFSTALNAAQNLRAHDGSWAGTIFAIALIDGSLLCAGVVTLTSGYAVGEVAGWRHSRHRGWSQAGRFYVAQALCILIAASVVLIFGGDLGLITVTVQALSGTLFPCAGVLLLLLCNDRRVLGPWVNGPLHNLVAAGLIGGLMVLSAISTLKAVDPRLGHVPVVVVGSLVAGAALAALVRPGESIGDDGEETGPRTAWTMPPIDRLPPPARSRRRTLTLVITRVYVLLTTAGLLISVVATTR